MARQLTPADHLIGQFDIMLRTLVPGAAQASRPSPAHHVTDDVMSKQERQHAAGLMRVNHTGEVCAQALYQGQGLTAKLEHVRDRMEEAAVEEIDHLVWCEDRLKELDSHTSLLNPLFYMASLSLGALTGRIGDPVSLGFVNATEELVGSHLDSHMKALPQADRRSRAIIEQMSIDEAHHAHSALEAGGKRFPLPVRWGMKLAAKVMTSSVYRI